MCAGGARRSGELKDRFGGPSFRVISTNDRAAKGKGV